MYSVWESVVLFVPYSFLFFPDDPDLKNFKIPDNLRSCDSLYLLLNLRLSEEIISLFISLGR